jgi:hypothetical protein
VKVKELMKQLEIYGQEDEILVLYFDKETTEEHHEQEITDQQWGEIVSRVENTTMPEIDYIRETIDEQTEQVLREGRKANA